MDRRTREGKTHCNAEGKALKEWPSPCLICLWSGSKAFGIDPLYPGRTNRIFSFRSRTTPTGLAFISRYFGKNTSKGGVAVKGVAGGGGGGGEIWG